jgi:uncharacterized protein (TIGR03067 family)
MLARLVLAAAGCIVWLNPVAAQPSKDDASALQGAWVIVGLEADGKPRPEMNFKGNMLTFKGQQVTLLERKNPPITLGFTLDASKKPKTIDLTAAEGPQKGKTLLAIYELKGDELRICFCFMEGKRPDDFTTKAEDQRELMTLKRGTPSKKVGS